MAVELTFGMIKPDAVQKGHTWHILADISSSGLRPVSVRLTRMTKEMAKVFYIVHKDRPFYDGLSTFMSSGPIMAMVLEGENAIHRYRELMGATDVKKAAPGTLRAKFGESIEKNAVHGSDALETARREISFFFTIQELTPLGVIIGEPESASEKPAK
jgi:nucleoside-diphosphate kinase